MHNVSLRSKFNGFSAKGKLQYSVNRSTLSDHFNGHIPGGIWVSQYQNDTVLDFIGAKGDGGGCN